MNVTFDGELYKIARITGPTHNYLALAVEEAGKHDVIMEALVHDDFSPPRLTAEVVKYQVMDAVAEFNATHQTTYSVRRIQFVVSDTLQPSDIYKRLAFEVLKHVREQTS